MILHLVALHFAAVQAPVPPQELYDYLSKKDKSFAIEKISADDRGTTIEMTSQTWQGIPWRHTIIMRQPAKLTKRGTGILYVTGDGPRAGDYRDLALMTAATGMPVAMLFNVPNQPLWGMKEDDLIGHTFEEYLKTSDPTWPLLFPMTKSAIRAMDAVEAATAKTANPIHRFVVTGASKRGWTTWFTGAAKDRRVIGIAPMVYDNLNVGAQMPHQLEQWGAYSEMIQDYTRRGLQQAMATPSGKHLAAIIDPFSYRKNIHVPTLIVRGANDPYWAADATRLYWNDLRQPHWLMSVPNAGHDLGGGISAAQTIGAFARSVAGEFRMPKVEGEVEQTGNKIRWTFSFPPVTPGLTPTEARLWVAKSDTHDFRKSTWVISDHVGFEKPGMLSREIEKPAGNTAAYIEFRFTSKGQPFSLTSLTKVF